MDALSLPWLAPAWAEFLQRAGGERLPHAVLVDGPAGTGKLALARAMAAWLLCLAPGERACGDCRSCRLLKGGAHPELFEVGPEEGSAQIRIEQVRAMVDSLNLTTTVSPRKLALLAPAEAMNRNAANSLLKCLEEPPGATVMLLVSHDPARLPVTIRSRCQRLPVRMPDAAVVRDWLVVACAVTPQAADSAVQAAAGSPLDARRMLEDGDIAGYEQLRKALAGLLAQPDKAGSAAGWLLGPNGLAKATEEEGRASHADMDRLWRWLSLLSAQALRARLADAPSAWLPGAPGLDPRSLADLQRGADRSRALIGRGLRQDLLLHQWLIEWARQPQAGG